MATKPVGTLTSVYNPPSYCLLNSRSAGWDFTTTAGYAQGWFENGALSDCLPNDSAGEDDNNRSYSPGVCPASWTPSPETVSNGKTTVHCCLSGTYPFAVSATGEAWGDWCGARISAPVLIHTGFSGVGDQFSAGEDLYISNTYIAVPVVHVTWATSDLPSFSPASAPLAMVAGSAFTVPSPSLTTSTTPAPPTTPTPSSTPTTSTPTSPTTSTISTTPANLGASGSETSAPSHSAGTISSVRAGLTDASTGGTITSTSGVVIASMLSKESQGLSTGAQAGIGVGAGIIGLAAVACGLLLAFRLGAKRAQKRQAYNRETQVEVVENVQPEMKSRW